MKSLKHLIPCSINSTFCKEILASIDTYSDKVFEP